MPKVNPEILRWARETAGLTPEEACYKLAIKGSRSTPAIAFLESLEKGEREPSRTTLLNMEKQYHRPLVVFYMSYIPQKGSRGQDFRTLSRNYSKKDDALVDALIRDIQSRQRIIRASLEDNDEELQPLQFVGSVSSSENMKAVADFLVKTIQFDLNKFYQKPSPADAFAYLRTQVENAGIFVLLMSNMGNYRTEIDVDGFRGFSLADNIAPFIVINDQDAKAALAFTLFHELTHICLGQTGISNNNTGNEIELFCDRVASEALLPSNVLNDLVVSNLSTFEDWQTAIHQFAKKRNISNSMVVVRLFQKGEINNELYTQLMQFYRDAWLNHKITTKKNKNKIGGPSYYQVHRYQIGNGLINLVQRLMSSGNLSSTKAGKVLGVKAGNVGPLISWGR